jgi:hypothetical protein
MDKEKHYIVSEFGINSREHQAEYIKLIYTIKLQSVYPIRKVSKVRSYCVGFILIERSRGQGGGRQQFGLRLSALTLSEFCVDA